ncbi:DUF11 domain-containing protein [Methanobrevibacter millerae]|uniref:DUF11 domain-containing protein n=1 Tax=Methanobrevibacter millerae TaxID=230361 RepID=A0A1G5VIY7_9EURY|nr:DUF11 domain-containing protein [Methanobrevibacter millerae]SDA45881.1 hypothetical protein SAMN02910315_00665 [Methanobrevibacter millerae]
MNRKSIFAIFLILIALSLTLGAVNAEEVLADNESGDEKLSVDESAAADELFGAEGDGSLQPAASGGDINRPVADLSVSIWPVESENEIVWSILVHNNGPDIAYNTQVTVEGSDNLILENPFNTSTFLQDPEEGVSFYESQGIFDNHKLTWIIGDFKPDSYTEMFIKSVKQGSGQYYLRAFAASESADDDLSQNQDMATVGYPSNTSQSDSVNETFTKKDTSSGTELPATGNPFVAALFGLMIIGAGGIKRKL